MFRNLPHDDRRVGGPVPNMIILLLTILSVMVMAWVFQGVRLHKSYTGDIYATLYGGFLPYFFRYVVFRDCSESGYLRSQIGPHKIIFSVISNEEQQRTKFCIIFYNKGIMVLCYDKSTGEFWGSSKDNSWNVKRIDADGKQHIYRHLNPTRDMAAYLNRVATAFPEVHIEARMAFRDEADLTHLRSDIKAIHFSELETELKEVQADFLPDDEVKAMYKQLIQK